MHPIYSAAAMVFGAIVVGLVVYFSARETPRSHSHSGSEGRPRSRQDSGNSWDWRGNNNISDGVSCGICLDTANGPTKVLRCKHEFHIECISEWFKTNNGNRTCPLCRYQ